MSVSSARIEAPTSDSYAQRWTVALGVSVRSTVHGLPSTVTKVLSGSNHQLGSVLSVDSNVLSRQIARIHRRVTAAAGADVDFDLQLLTLQIFGRVRCELVVWLAVT